MLPMIFVAGAVLSHTVGAKRTKRTGINEKGSGYRRWCRRTYGAKAAADGGKRRYGGENSVRRATMITGKGRCNVTNDADIKELEP